MEHLKIRKFGPLKEVEFNIQDYMIFIGPNASGKTTILKLLYIFQSFREEVFRTIYDIVEGLNSEPFPERILKANMVEKFSEYWSNLKSYGDFFVRYDYDDAKSVSIFQKKKVLEVIFSEKLELDIREIFTILKKYLSDRYYCVNEAGKAAFYKGFEKYISVLFGRERNPIFIPAGRVIAYGVPGEYIDQSLDKTIEMFIQRIPGLRLMYCEKFKKLMNNHEVDSIGEKNRERILMAIALSKQILEGDYVYDRDFEGIYSEKENMFIEMADVSTGQQEALWLVQQLLMVMLSGLEYLLIIEEPEAHLCPMAHKFVMELIALVKNCANNRIVVTTNSPNVLRVINNQLYAREVGKVKAKKVMSDKMWLSSDLVGAYIVENATMRPIVDTERKMIKSTEIDIAGDLLEKEMELMRL